MFLDAVCNISEACALSCVISVNLDAASRTREKQTKFLSLFTILNCNVIITFRGDKVTEMKIEIWNDGILVCVRRRREAIHANDEACRGTVIEEYDPEADTWTMSQIELPQRLCSYAVFTIETGIYS